MHGMLDAQNIIKGLSENLGRNNNGNENPVADVNIAHIDIQNWVWVFNFWLQYGDNPTFRFVLIAAGIPEQLLAG